MSDAPEHGQRLHGVITQQAIKKTAGTIKAASAAMEIATGESGTPPPIPPGQHRGYALTTAQAVKDTAAPVRACSLFFEIPWKNPSPPRHVFMLGCEIAEGIANPSIIHPNEHRLYLGKPAIASKRQQGGALVKGAFLEVAMRNFPVEPNTTIHFLY